MTFRSMLDRTIELIPRNVDGEDDHGNDRIVSGDPITIRAARHLWKTDEAESDGDRIRSRWAYLLPPRTDDGELLTITSYFQVRDAGDLYEIVGEPELLTLLRSRRPHHWEFVARKVRG